ncbi:MAG: c-type cytochrome [Gammaproteobacteria bacterium]
MRGTIRSVGRAAVLLAATSISLASIVAPSSVQAQAFDEYSGEETFDRFCASCHGIKGRGDGPVAPGLAIAVPDLSLLQERRGADYRDTTLRKIIDGREVIIYHGTRYMPVWGYEFWVEEGADEAAEASVETIIENLIDHIETLQREPAAK